MLLEILWSTRFLSATLVRIRFITSIEDCVVHGNELNKYMKEVVLLKKRKTDKVEAM